MQHNEIQSVHADQSDPGGGSYPFDLPATAIDVWTIKIHPAGTLDAAFEAVLNPEEQDRAHRLAFPHLRYAFVVAHGALRHLLARYLDVHPAAIRISSGPSGKPALASREDIQFNLTHSGDLAAIAIARGCAVGIDIEAVHSTPDLLSVANAFFRPEEAAEIRSLPERLRTQAFFRCWVRKEACIKATGAGFSMPLNSFSVAALPNSTADPLVPGRKVSAPDRWTLHDLRLAPDYAAALAHTGSPRAIRVGPPVTVEQLLRMCPLRSMHRRLHRTAQRKPAIRVDPGPFPSLTTGDFGP